MHRRHVGVVLSGARSGGRWWHERRRPLREAEQLGLRATLLGDAVVLQLEEEAAWAEDVAVLPRQLACAVPVLDLQRPRDLTAEARGQADEALAVAGEVLLVDARLVVVAIDVRVGDEATQVLIAGPVLGQQDEVADLGVLAALALGHRVTRDVGLHADDGLDALGGARLVERDRAVQRAMIGDGERVEAQALRLGGQVVDPPEAVKEAELRVDVEVDEVIVS